MHRLELVRLLLSYQLHRLGDSLLYVLYFWKIFQYKKDSHSFKTTWSTQSKINSSNILQLETWTANIIRWPLIHSFSPWKVTENMKEEYCAIGLERIKCCLLTDLDKLNQIMDKTMLNSHEYDQELQSQKEKLWEKNIFNLESWWIWLHSSSTWQNATKEGRYQFYPVAFWFMTCYRFCQGKPSKW